MAYEKVELTKDEILALSAVLNRVTEGQVFKALAAARLIEDESNGSDAAFRTAQHELRVVSGHLIDGKPIPPR